MKRFINAALYLEQLKRFWPIAAISMLGYVLFIVQPLYFSPHFNTEHIADNMLVIMSMRNPVLVISMVAVPFFTALALFSYPYRAASATAYHSFPISRMQLFFTQGFTGLTLMLVPLLLLTLIMLVPISHNEPFSLYLYPPNGDFVMAVFGRDNILVGETINTLPRMLGFFLRSTLGFVMYFAVFTLAASIAGNRVIAVILSAVLAFAPMALVGLSGIIGSFYLFGFGFAPISPINTVAMYTHPGNWGMAYGGFTFLRGQHDLVRPLAPFFISYGLITIAAFGLAFTAYRLRPHERAGDTVAFLPIKRVLIFLFALAGMVILGVFWLNVSGIRFGLYIGFIVGFITAYFIAQMIAEKTFRIGHKVKYVVSYGAVALGLYVMLLLVTGLGFWGFVRHVPEPEEIAGVFIVQSVRRDSRDGQGREDHFFIDDPAIIAQVRDIHEGIIAERRHLQQIRWNHIGWRLIGFGFDDMPINITYRLTNGRTIQRLYMVTSEFYRNWRINNLLESGPVVLSHSPALAQPGVIDSVSFHVNLEHSWTFINEFDQARINADAQGVSVEEVLGDREFILDFVFGRWPNVRTPHQIAELVAAIQLDILAIDYGFDWNNTISISILIRNQYVRQNWGRTWFQVPLNGYAAEWLINNGFMQEWAE